MVHVITAIARFLGLRTEVSGLRRRKWPSGLFSVLNPQTSVLFFFLVASFASAEDSVTLPLKGYYRPGRYMPVRVVADPPNGSPNAIVVRGVETVNATVNSRGGERLDATVPVMPVRADAPPLRWAWLMQAGHDVSPPLRTLKDNQRLVAYAGIITHATDAARLAAELYPACEPIVQSLNPADPMPGTPACWEALDLVLLDGPSAQRVGEQRFSSLVAAGVAFAVRAERPPWPHWPWVKSAGGWWTLRYTPAGPAGATYNPEAYVAVSSLRPGWTAKARWRYALEGLAFLIAMLLLALWRPRYLAWLAVLVAGGTGMMLAYWHQWERPLRMVEGKVRVITPTITQDDDWAYFAAPQRTFSRNRWVDTMKLVLSGPGLIEDMDPRVECLSNGDPDALAFSVPANGKAALLCRRCGPQAPAIAPTPGGTSPLQRLARDEYLGSGDVIVGELPTSPLISESYFQFEQWPAVVIRRGK